MALPTIPTSFVPHPAASNRNQFKSTTVNIAAIVAYMSFFAAIALSIGVFAYGHLLKASKASKEVALQKAEQSIDLSTVKSFIHLRDRLDQGETLMTSHIAVSSFFSIFSALLPQTVRFSSLHLAISKNNAAPKVEGTGTAKSLNAIVVAANSLASDSRFNDVIFSKITVTNENAVSFNFSATFDQELIAYHRSSATNAAAAITATTTSAAIVASSTLLML